MGPEPPIPRLGLAMWKRFVIGGFLILALTAATTATAGLLDVKNVADSFSKGNKRLKLSAGVITKAQAGEPQTILLLGSDIRKADRLAHRPGRSDTMILVRLDPNKQTTAVLSVPRDLKVQIHYKGTVQTAKINDAYSLGGPSLIAETIKRILHVQINHVVDIDFRGFRDAVNFLGCVYVDVDRRYFNDNSGPVKYATINIKPGYQKLCGQDALDYVRYRHEDTDLVRSARQQDFLSQLKDQNSVRKLFSDRAKLARLFGRYTHTDIRGTNDVLRLIKLAIFSAGNPIREVHFRATLAPLENGVSYVEATPAQIQQSVREFLSGTGSKGPKGQLASTPSQREAARKRKPKKAAAVPGLEDAQTAGEDQAIAIAGKVPFPVYYPRLRTTLAVYSDVPRVYVLPDEDGHRHMAYRMVIKRGLVGEYYGVQATNWMDPPILAQSHDTEHFGGRTYLVYYDGDRIARIAFKTRHAAYWLSNTLLRSLSNTKMRAIAHSLRRIGR